MNSTIMWMTARGLFGRRRFLFLLPLPVLVIALAAIARSTGVDPRHWATPVLIGLGVAVVLPVVALVVGSGVLGSEIDDGTIVHILSKPTPRWQIVVSKLAVAVGVTTVTVAIPMYAAGVLAESVRLGLALAAASAIGTLAYSTLFLALSLVTRRPVLLLGSRLVGKTTLLHEHVYRTVEQRQGRHQLRNNVWLLAPQRLISGMSYVGQWENRLLAIIKEARRRKHVLYFDDLLGLFQAGVSA